MPFRGQRYEEKMKQPSLFKKKHSLHLMADKSLYVLCRCCHHNQQSDESNKRFLHNVKCLIGCPPHVLSFAY